MAGGGSSSSTGTSRQPPTQAKFNRLINLDMIHMPPQALSSPRVTFKGDDLEIESPSLGRNEEGISKRSPPNELIKANEPHACISPELQPVEDLPLNLSPRY